MEELLFKTFYWRFVLEFRVPVESLLASRVSSEVKMEGFASNLFV